MFFFLILFGTAGISVSSSFNFFSIFLYIIIFGYFILLSFFLFIFISNRLTFLNNFCHSDIATKSLVYFFWLFFLVISCSNFKLFKSRNGIFYRYVLCAFFFFLDYKILLPFQISNFSFCFFIVDFHLCHTHLHTYEDGIHYESPSQKYHS